MRDARKTVALRAGPTGYTPSNSAASNPCLNCGTNVQLAYCPECGQRAIDPNPTLREFVQELAQEFLNWDGKLFTTFRLLLSRPGELTQEYLAGRRVSYISPLRLYLTCSVLYFLVSAITPSAPSTFKTSPGTRDSALVTKLGPLTVESSDRAAIQQYLDSTSRSAHVVERTLSSHFANALGRGKEFTNSLKAGVPRMMFVLVPFFAWLVSIVFRRQKLRYPQHLTFALHVHAFMFAALIPTHAAGLISVRPLQALLELTGVGAVVWYLVQSLRRVYATTLGGAIGRSALLIAVYGVAFAVAMTATFLLVLLLQY